MHIIPRALGDGGSLRSYERKGFTVVVDRSMSSDFGNTIGNMERGGV